VDLLASPTRVTGASPRGSDRSFAACCVTDKTDRGRGAGAPPVGRDEERGSPPGAGAESHRTRRPHSIIPIGQWAWPPTTRGGHGRDRAGQSGRGPLTGRS